MEYAADRTQSKYMIGVAALILSAILTALSQVYYGNRVQSVHPFLFTGISFFITTCYFQWFARKQRLPYYWRKAISPLVKLNLSSALTFMGFYYALKYIEPAIVSSLEMGIGPLFVILIALFQRKAVTLEKWGIAVGTLLTTFLLIYAVFTGQSATAIQWDVNVLLGIFASVACGLGAVLCTIYSKQLSNEGWTSSMILSKRFYGIILLSFFFTYDLIFDYALENIGWILVITFTGVLIPMYLLQKGIQYCETFLVMMSLCFIPVITFFLQLFDSRLQWSNLTLVGVLLLFGLGISSVYVERKA
ncbi:DMT family transporter [Sporosarcina newyorkensis]|uniref:EamA-like transporter family protein n=1 Tax=Sporosarcina newyorkensis TaxID=759851 RepID=A0A1T4XL21_9BACL|nr:DMT family transporter [Sporosarcina newyorkensis]SKA89781.1 EamA-like transporter family protein [Sporosarcina newyorkensis]